MKDYPLEEEEGKMKRVLDRSTAASIFRTSKRKIGRPALGESTRSLDMIRYLKKRKKKGRRNKRNEIEAVYLAKSEELK